MSNKVLGQITSTPATPKPGQSVLIEVLDVNGNQLRNVKISQVSINGIPGARRYVQYKSVGKYTVVATLKHKNGTDTVSIEINVQGAPISVSLNEGGRYVTKTAMLQVSQLAESPYEVEFTFGEKVEEGISSRLPLTLDGFFKPTFDWRPVIFENTDVLLDNNTNDIFSRPNTKTYQWDFGNGKIIESNSSLIKFDYSQLINSSSAQSWDVTCKVLPDNVSATRTLTLFSPYGISKNMGTIVPLVKADQFVSVTPNSFVAEIIITNIEDEIITLTSRSFSKISSNKNEKIPLNFINLDKPLQLSKNSDTAISVHIPMSEELAVGATALNVRYVGMTASGIRVSISCVLEIPISAQRNSQSPQIDIADIPTFEDIDFERSWSAVKDNIDKLISGDNNPVCNPQFCDPKEFDNLDINIALKDGHITVSAPRNKIINNGPLFKSAKMVTGIYKFKSNEVNSAAFMFIENRPAIDPVEEGGVCRPDNISSADLAIAEEENLVCQLSNESVEVTMPGRFMNAAKGDIILSPGGPGIIGDLLRHVTPSQGYSHSGIMTNNFEEVTHSTASAERLKSYPDSLIGGTLGEPTDGFRPDILKYMWPGVVAQSVEHAVHGEKYIDPENGKELSISSFSSHSIGLTHNDDFVVTPPLVIKPFPLLEYEDSTLRDKLHQIADEAKSIAGTASAPSKSHYRLFCYTDPTIQETDVAPSEAGWAAGTFPSVCSSFIWMMAKQKGISLEGAASTLQTADLELGDIEAGAEVTAGTPDGLYLYTKKEREEAATHLFNKIHSIAFDKTGWLVEFISDASDDVANQLINTFALDDSDDRSDSWESGVVDANAVSPSNILFWDGPETGGVYGYAEPLIYREPRTERYTPSHWVKMPTTNVVPTKGDLIGSIKEGGDKISGARISIGSFIAFSDRDGNYKFNSIPFGRYEIEASKVINSILYSTKQTVLVNQVNETVNLVLEAPAERFRLVTILLDFRGVDSERLWPDEVYDPGPEQYKFELSDDRQTNSKKIEYKWGDEMRMEYIVDATLSTSNDVRIRVFGKLFEGTTEDNKDLDGTGELDFMVPPGSNKTVFRTLLITNTEEEVEDDKGELRISVRNERNNN